MTNSIVLFEKPTDPRKDIPAKPDKNPDPTKPRPGGNEPDKIDPTRIEEPDKVDPTRIVPPPEKSPGTIPIPQKEE